MISGPAGRRRLPLIAVAYLAFAVPSAIAQTVQSTPSDSIYFEFQVDRPARRIGGLPPVYPPELKASKVKGNVLAQFVVLEDGTADMVTFRIVRSSNDLFSRAVRDVLPQMRFASAEHSGKKVKQLVQLPFDFKVTKPETDSIVSLASTLPVSSPAHVYTASEVDKAVRNLNGLPVPSTLPAEIVALAGQDALLEFVVNADGSIEPSTIKVLRAPSDELGAAHAKGALDLHFLPAELGGKKVRQIVQLDTPVRLQRIDAPARLDPASRPYDPSQVDIPARPAYASPGPVYPRDLKASGIEGSVLAQFTVLGNGTADIDTFKAIRSSNDEFTSAVRDAVRRMRFIPAQIHGRAVKQVVRLPFDFRLAR